MLQEKYIIIAIVIIVLVGGLIGVYFIQKHTPGYDTEYVSIDAMDMIDRKFNFKLPSSSKIINYKYYSMGGYFDAKILIDTQAVESIKKSLVEYFKNEYIIKNDDEIPNFQNSCDWWDLDKKNIESCYNIMIFGENEFSPKTRDVWAFITNEKDGQCYLYISY